MNEIVDQINELHREVRDGRLDWGEARTVLLRRSYRAEVDDVWDALTSPERIPRWIRPVSGDLRLGGTYQLEGNAGGEILRCEPPRLLRVSWVFGDMPASEVEVRLTGAGETTEFELAHTVPADDHWAKFGPGAVGVGWDLTLLGLELHLRGGELDEPEAWLTSPEAAEFMTRSSSLWGAAHEQSGATAEEAAAAAASAAAFYVPQQG
jgi:uncharacterized protein YndB with AHSA1/START domain